jgi:hypothetical protein
MLSDIPNSIFLFPGSKLSPLILVAGEEDEYGALVE